MRAPSSKSRESGQAMVEAALTLPLTVFLILGTLQLFLMLQARILSEYAVFRATRAGSVNMADCRVMTHAAIAALLPSITATNTPQRLGRAFELRRDNQYQPGNGERDGLHDRPIVWLVPSLTNPSTSAGLDDATLRDAFDDHTRVESRTDLNTQMVFWYPMKIPFANWVMGRMFLAWFGGAAYTAQNPLLLTEQAQWNEATAQATLSTQMRNELQTRVLSGQYVAPIRTSYAMRMMTPALQRRHACPNSPESL